MAGFNPIKGARALSILRQGIQLPNGQVVQFVNPLDLEVDHSYQRPLKQASVDKIRRNFNEDHLGIFQVSRRKNDAGGKGKLTDAQHRWAAIKALHAEGKKIPKDVLALITNNTTREQEAEQFVNLNSGKPVTGNNKFKANLVYGQNPEAIIDRWVRAEGFVLSFLSPGTPTPDTTEANGIYSVNALLTAYNKCPKTIRPALKLLKAAWGGGKAKNVPWDIRSGQVVYGIALFLASQGTKNVDRLAKRLKFNDVAAIWKRVRSATAGWNRYDAFAEALKELCY